MTSMLSAKLKMAQSKLIASTWKCTKSRTCPRTKPVVAVPHRAGHDQAQSDGQHPAGGGSEHEQVIEDHDRGHDRKPGENQAAARQAGTDAPECTRVLAGVQLQNPGNDGREAAQAGARFERR